MSNLLTFDLATRTGWCFSKHGNSDGLASGFFDLPKKVKWHEALLFFSVKVFALIGKYEPDEVIVEKPQRFRNQDAARVAYSLYHSLKQEWPKKPVDVNGMTLKKWATGTGRAEKEQMVEAARARTGVAVVDHNEADAILLACYGREVLGL